MLHAQIVIICVGGCIQISCAWIDVLGSTSLSGCNGISVLGWLCMVVLVYSYRLQ